MEPSLSIVLPIRNAEHALTAQVQRLLEMLPELSSRFEVLVVDNASTDSTIEVAWELATRFPQVQVLRLPKHVKMKTAADHGLDRATGDLVFVQDGPTLPSPNDLRRLWRMRGDELLVMACARPQPLAPSLIMRLNAWGRALKENSSPVSSPTGVRMVRRRALPAASTA